MAGPLKLGPSGKSGREQAAREIAAGSGGRSVSHRRLQLPWQRRRRRRRLLLLLLLQAQVWAAAASEVGPTQTAASHNAAAAAG